MSIDTSRSPADATDDSFAAGERWRLHPSVALRPEPFGALLYHFGNRRLIFVKDLRLLAVVRALADAPSAAAACSTAGFGPPDAAPLLAALARLARSGLLVRSDS